MDGKKTKADLVDSVYDNVLFYYKTQRKTKCPFAKDDIALVVNEFVETLSVALKDGHSVELRGLGSFTIKKRSKRSSCVNPRTGEPAKSEEHSVVVFTSGRDLKEAVWDL